MVTYIPSFTHQFVIILSLIMTSSLPIEDGTVRFCAPVSGEVWGDWLDPEHDIGAFTAGKCLPAPKYNIIDILNVKSSNFC